MLPESFWSRVEKTETCWLWRGVIDKDGYGTFWSGGHTGHYLRAHRLAYENVHGPIPDGLVTDHLCRVRSCVNPDHIEPVTRGENVMRGETLTASKKAQTHCIHGHPFDEANTYVWRGRKRMCRACAAARMRERKRRLQSLGQF